MANARYVYSELANAIQARKNCEKRSALYCCKGIWKVVGNGKHQGCGNWVGTPKHPRYEMPTYLCAQCRDQVEHVSTLPEETSWYDRWEEFIERLEREYLPSGSGFDSGTKIDLDASHADKLVFTTSYHHMNDAGMYDGWTEHTVTVTPSFVGGFNIRVSGRNRNDIKDYIGEEFSEALRSEVTETV